MNTLYYEFERPPWACMPCSVRVDGLGKDRRTPARHIAMELDMTTADLVALCKANDIPLCYFTKRYSDGCIMLTDLPRVMRLRGWSEANIELAMDQLHPKFGAKTGKDRRKFVNSKNCPDSRKRDASEDEEDEPWQPRYVEESKLWLGPEGLAAYQKTEACKAMKRQCVEEAMMDYDAELRASVRERLEPEVRDKLRAELRAEVNARLEADAQLQARLEQEEAVRVQTLVSPPRKGKELLHALLSGNLP